MHAAVLDSPEVALSAEFGRWFAGSKVVDAQGLPRMVEHGTNAQFEAFEPSAVGTFGPGIYFCDAETGSARVYGDHVHQVYLSLRNPWTIEVDPCGDIVEDEDFDHPGIEAILALPDGRAILEEARSRQSLVFGRSLQRQLQALGHDGVIATYPDGCMEFVAFSADQVRPCGPVRLATFEEEEISCSPRF